MKPDYGLHLINSGVPSDIIHSFYDIPFDHISIIDSENFSTTINLIREGIEYALSFDYGIRVLSVITNELPLESIQAIRQRFHLDRRNNMVTVLTGTIILPYPILLNVSAKFGKTQKAMGSEVFVPFIIQEAKTV